MTQPEILVYPNFPTLSRAAADQFKGLANQFVQSNDVFAIAISGGSTPRGMFSELASSDFRDNTPWESIQFFWCDERCVAPDHPESNYGQAMDDLLSHVPTLPKNIHRIRGEMGPIPAAAQYREELKTAALNQSEYPAFDLIILGLGEDGHIASLFPGVTDPSENILPVRTAQAFYHERPVDRVTLTPLVFNQAHNIVFLVSGPGKAKAVFEALYGFYDPLNKPAQRIHPAAGQVFWILDQQSAGLLPASGD